MNFAKFLRTPIVTEHLRWLLLNFRLFFISAYCRRKLSFNFHIVTLPSVLILLYHVLFFKFCVFQFELNELQLSYICVFKQLFIHFTVNVMKLVIMHISRLLCIISSPIGKCDEKRKFYQIFRLFCIIFILNGEFEYQIDYLSQ